MSGPSNSTWIPRLSTADTLSLVRLVASPRTLVVVLGAAAWTLGAGWMAAMVRFGSGGYGNAEEQRYFNGLVVALVVFALPAMCGVVVSEAIQELLRRPLTNRLPAIAQRTGAAASTLALLVAVVLGVLGYFVSSPQSLLLGPTEGTRPTLLGFVALALLGYPAGAWLRAQLGPRFLGLVFFALFLGLAYVALPILNLASDSAVAGTAIAMLGSAGTWTRFHPRLCERVAKLGMPTTFQFLSGLTGGRGAKVELLGDGGLRLPAGASGGSVRGWWTAHRFEQHTLRRSLGKDSGLFWLAAGAFAACFVESSLKTLFGVEGTISVLGIEATGSTARDLLGGVRGGLDLAFESALRGALLIVGGSVVVVALQASAPLLGRFPYPIARRQRASLTMLVAARTLAVYLALFAGVALLARVWILPLLGVDSAPGVPPILRLFLVQCALFVPYLLLSLWTRDRLRRGRRWTSFGLLVLGMVLLFASAGSLQHWADADLWNSWWQVSLCLIGALVLGFSLLAVVLSRYYRRCDLV
ncbi:MAG: hypothetical protein GC161_09415 [Planctomycetaceae bacterium]|nr:hypothetical protein [Planctomycetaceae bacterium]